MIRVKGGASGSVVGEFPIDNPEEVLMFFLMRHNIPVASSCAGEGICKKCVVNGGLLSCQTRVGDFLDGAQSRDVILSYL